MNKSLKYGCSFTGYRYSRELHTKILLLTFLVAHGNAPEYLSELRVLHKPNRALRSANQPFFKQRIHSPRLLAIELL